MEGLGRAALDEFEDGAVITCSTRRGCSKQVAVGVGDEGSVRNSSGLFKLTTVVRVADFAHFWHADAPALATEPLAPAPSAAWGACSPTPGVAGGLAPSTVGWLLPFCYPIRRHTTEQAGRARWV